MVRGLTYTLVAEPTPGSRIIGLLGSLRGLKLRSGPDSIFVGKQGFLPIF